MLVFYLGFLTVVALVIVGGYDATMRLFYYIDLNIRFFFIRIRMWFFKKKLERQLQMSLKKFKSSKEKTDV
jgi:hypothetical protein